MWRVWQPFAELTRRGMVADWCHKDESDKILPWIAAGRYNIVVTPRIVWPFEGAGDPWVRTIHKAGMSWVYEVDDDVYSPRIVERQTTLFESERLKGKEQLEWERQERIRFLSIVDGVTVSTERLANIVRRYAPPGLPVLVVPNSISGNCGKPYDASNVGCCWRHWLKDAERVVPPLTIGWAGGTREQVDLVQLAQAWSILADRYPQVTFVVQGHIPPILAECVPPERKMTLPWLSLGEYPRGLLNIDIGCCPLAANVFNSAKSPIKWYEMTLAGAACVVSPTVYGQVVRHNRSACVADSVSDWVHYLSRMVEDTLFRRSVRETARRQVMEQHTIQKNWWRWPEAWLQVLEYAQRPRVALP